MKVYNTQPFFFFFNHSVVAHLFQSNQHFEAEEFMDQGISEKL